MEDTRARQPVQKNPEGSQDANRHCTQDPVKGGETGDPSKDQQVGHSSRQLSVITPERLTTAKALVAKAIKMHKIFCVQGPYPVIRAGLRARGWVERRTHPAKPRTHKLGNSSSRKGIGLNDADDSDHDDCLLDESDPDNVEKEDDPEGVYEIMCRLVRNEVVYFYWTNRIETIEARTLQKEQIINHFIKAGTFTTKVGLCVNLRNLHWFDSADPDTFFPRCYRLGAQDEKHAFIEDYQRTACVSLLQCIVERQNVGHGVRIQSDQNKKKQCKHLSLPLSTMIECALKVCQDFLESLEHGDIDTSVEATQSFTKELWTEFIDNYYHVVHGGAVIEDTTSFVTRCEKMLQMLHPVSPQLDTDGTHNIWIIKPGAKSRGRGIKCSKRLDEILSLVDSDPTLIKDSKWVVQKYLERPLLVHGTKFDVRQWFLVTDWNPLTVWFYKKCYLRFSTQPYSLENLDNSVHLCNNSIQRHLRPSELRHQGIPADNMWSDDQFRVFLSSQGREDQWEAVTVGGMKTAVIHALQTAQDLMESRHNAFELFGADFILGCDLRPWLIEINVSPTMASSTAVTARLCAAVQEDTLRVVLDRRADRTADTGDFQLIYQQAVVEVPQYVGINLLVEGSKIKHPRTRRAAARPRKPPETRDEDPSKVKELAEKANPPPNKLNTEVSQLSPCSRVPRTLPSKQLLPIEIYTLELPIDASGSTNLPVSTQSGSKPLSRRQKKP